MAEEVFITDITHFLDTDGEIPKSIPKEARELANFMVLIIDKVTKSFPKQNTSIETGIRCHSKGCYSNIIGALDSETEPINWFCLECGNNGIISNWQVCRWNNIN